MSQPRKPPRSMEELEFTRRRMTEWFEPRQLVATGVHALLSSIFGAYADKRELQAALDPPGQGQGAANLPYDFDKDGEFWLDYVADLGDGFDATYSVASLLAKPALTVPYTEAGVERSADTRRGSILLFGGDQVYPSPTRDAYRDRLYGPYEAARPWSTPGTESHLYALPGNHDWYDGLTGFMRLFCQGRWIGGWKTQQRRSYFAVKLPGAWWLWGLDLQLTADMDEPQVEYFRTAARRVRPEDRLIIATPGPSWVQVGMGQPNAFEVLDFFLKKVVAPTGARASVLLSGDLHHYARYETDAGEQRITSGGGGAYLYPTHNLPTGFTVKREDPATNEKREETLELRCVYPTANESRTQAPRVMLFLWRNKWFAALLGALYLFFSWVLENASGSSLLGTLAPLELHEWKRALALTWDVTWRSPASSLFAAVIVAGLMLFATSDRKDRWRIRVGRLVGAVHGVAHLVAAALVMWAVASLIGISEADSGWRVVLFILGMLVAGTTAGGILMGAYLLLSNLLLRLHDNETFSSQGIENYKNFLRLKLTANGSLTIYPVTIDKAIKDWRINPELSDAQPWLPWVIAKEKEPECRLAEPPVVVAGNARPEQLASAPLDARVHS